MDLLLDPLSISMVFSGKFIKSETVIKIVVKKNFLKLFRSSFRREYVSTN